MSTIRISIEGVSPMLQHNVRLANPLDPHTRALKQLTAKRKKTDDDLAQIMWAEARAGAYETPESLIGMPDCNLWRSLQDAARAQKRGKDVERGLLYDPVRVVALDIGGRTYGVEEYIARPDAIDYRPVKVGQSTVMRSRPVIHEWRLTHEFELLDDVLMLEDIEAFAERAGRLYGIGDHRPQYGRFRVLSVEEVK